MTVRRDVERALYIPETVGITPDVEARPTVDQNGNPQSDPTADAAIDGIEGYARQDMAV